MKVKWDYLLLPIYGKSSKSWFQTTNQNPISIHNYGKIHHFQWVNPTICIYILVGGLNPTEKYESQMGLFIAPNIWKVIKVMVPNHQPESHFHS